MVSSEASTRRRVKLYMLNDERQWDDKGTGHVSALYTEQDSMALVVISETDGSYLLESKIQPDTAYQKQQETLIVWSEGESMDLALSFQEKVGCDDVWEKICAVQGKDPSVDITQEVVDDNDDADDAEGYTPTTIQSIEPLPLPPCELSHLEETVELVSQAVTSPPKRDQLTVLLESTNYLNQLTDLFHKAEDLEDTESLQHMYEIIRQIILLNKHSLYETLFADDMLMDVVGMLEYVPSGRVRHRDFLRNIATFKEVLPLHNTDLVSKIHQTYRVQFIQEYCLPPPCLFDEHTLSQLKAFVSLNKMEIIRALQSDEEFMCHLFARLKSTDTELVHRKELSLFVKEFCSISIQTDQKESFLTRLLQHGALRTAEVLLTIDDRDIKSAALEILHAFIEHQPSVVREYVFKETAPYRKDDELLISLMIDQLLSDPDPELSDAFLLGFMLRIIIDPENMNNPGVRGEKTEFLSFFYKRCINSLVRPLFENTVQEILDKDDYHTALVLNHILELLTFCIETHTYHMKNYCFNRDLLKRVLVLLQSTHKFLVLSAIRLLRRVVNMKEEFYNRYLIKNNLFKPVIKLFVSNEHRYNLVDSAIIELFDYIHSEKITTLLTHLIDNYWDVLKNITYVQTFADLKRTYDHTHRPPRPALVGSVGQQPTLDVRSLVSPARFQRDARALELEEEQWFDQDEEEEEEEDEDEDEGSQVHHHHQHQQHQLFAGHLTTMVNGTSQQQAGPMISTSASSSSSLSITSLTADGGVGTSVDQVSLPATSTTTATTLASSTTTGFTMATHSGPLDLLGLSALACNTNSSPSTTTTNSSLAHTGFGVMSSTLGSTVSMPQSGSHPSPNSSTAAARLLGNSYETTPSPPPPDRLRSRPGLLVDETDIDLVTRSHSVRQWNTISIHIKSTTGSIQKTADSLAHDYAVAGSSVDATGGGDVEMKALGGSSSDVTANDNETDLSLHKTSKRLRESDEPSLSPDSVQPSAFTSSSSPSIEEVVAASTSASPVTEPPDCDSAPVGLVDYSDEDSGDEDTGDTDRSSAAVSQSSAISSSSETLASVGDRSDTACEVSSSGTV